MDDALLLSRLQFAANISFHILFPTITMALAGLLAYFKIRFDLSRDPLWMRAYRFWVKVFALSFALGVVSGITLSFQFGTNWPGYMGTVGNIAGPLLGYEVLTAFFMEATFLGVMLFGQGRVPNWMHTLATIVVMIGTSLSAFWILALNSWMHTPAGFEMIDDVAQVTDWWAVIFNPSFPYRFIHMLLASGLTACFLMAGISAYRIQRGDPKRAPRLTLKTGLFGAALLAPLQILVGDLHGLNTFEHQPQKVAAMEGVWDTRQAAPLLLFAVPDEETRSNHLEIAIPALASFILTHDTQGTVPGLNDYEDNHPPVKPVFYGFRLMVGMGLLMLLVAWLGSYQLWRRNGLSPWLQKGVIAMSFSGWIATLAGWYVTEIGRQPWLVTGVLKTEEAVTDIAADKVLLTFCLYVGLYVVLLLVYLSTLFLMARRAIEIEEMQPGEIGIPEYQHPLQKTRKKDNQGGAS